jgi:2-polyprenyl-3-methyl-5-hydroxy-6-metoxy-1,4-benzoquinol methylase
LENKEFVKKVNPREAEYLGIISNWYHSKPENFKTLYVPKLYSIEYKEDGIYAHYEYIEGKQYQWSEHEEKAGYGGKDIPIETVTLCFNTLKELGGFTNNDFQFRNLIFMDNGKVAVVDYENAEYTEDQLYRNSSYIFMLMWNNPEWKKEFVKILKTENKFDKNKFWRCLNGNLLRLIRHWKDNEKLVKVILDQITNQKEFDLYWEDINIDEIKSGFSYQYFPEFQTEPFSQKFQSNSPEKLRYLNLPNLDGKVILDIGCNTGYFPLKFAELGADCVYGIDPLQKNIDKANGLKKIYGYEFVHFYEDDLLKITAKFSMITCLSMFHYVEDKAEFINKISTLLYTHVKGLFILETPIAREDTILDIEPRRYVPSEKTIMDLTRERFELIYKGQSNLPDRMVYHFKVK